MNGLNASQMLVLAAIYHAMKIMIDAGLGSATANIIGNCFLEMAFITRSSHGYHPFEYYFKHPRYDSPCITPASSNSGYH